MSIDTHASPLAKIVARRPLGQAASIARQLTQLMRVALRPDAGFELAGPVAIGVCGGRARLAFMHPDMARFLGPAWQMPTGAKDASGDEQIVLLLQGTSDHAIHFHSLVEKYGEPCASLPVVEDVFSPHVGIADVYGYEHFGLNLSDWVSEQIAKQMQWRRAPGVSKSAPLPARRCRPFSLVANALASLRTQRLSAAGQRVQAALGRDRFTGARILATGRIPEGGFASSSAFVVALLNGFNALYDLRLSDETIVELACQAEFGTGVRAGALDHATLQKGRAGVGTLMSSDPALRFATLGEFNLPTQRIELFFAFSVARERDAHLWSFGHYAESESSDGVPTPAQLRSLTGKAAELAALLLRVPLQETLFARLEQDLTKQGRLSLPCRRWVCDFLRRVPLRVTKHELKQRVEHNMNWLTRNLTKHENIDSRTAESKAQRVFDTLFSGWCDPMLLRASHAGSARECGVPLRAIVTYLFAEVAKNYALIHQPEQWIQWVTRSQRGDRTMDIDLDRLPARDLLAQLQPWERSVHGPARLRAWLEYLGAVPFDYNRDLDDETLGEPETFDLCGIRGSSFFRGLALIDLGEAMLKRAFGENSVAVRVSGAGQGGYFQVHVDRTMACTHEVQNFLQSAFYARFQLAAPDRFVAAHPGGSATGVRLDDVTEIGPLAHALARASSEMDV